MVYNNKYAFAELKEFTKDSNYVGAASAMIEVAKEKGIQEGLILETLLVKNPKDFGKGYGKNLFQAILSLEEVILIYPFGVPYFQEDKTYSGRRRWDTIEDMEEGKEELVEKFYKPILKKSGRRFIEVKLENNTMILVF